MDVWWVRLGYILTVRLGYILTVRLGYIMTVRLGYILTVTSFYFCVYFIKTEKEQSAVSQHPRRARDVRRTQSADQTDRDEEASPRAQHTGTDVRKQVRLSLYPHV